MNLYQRIHAVMNDSEGLDKEMVVGSGSFSYKAISEAAVLNLIKPLLKKHGLVILPVGMQVVDRLDVFSTPKGESNRLMTQIVAKYKIVDIETGESEILETVGNGVDTQDKASGKAMTYGYKALMQKTFCLFSGEDTDNEHSNDITDKQTKLTSKAKLTPTGTPQSAYTKPQLITPDQCIEVNDIFTEHGWDLKKAMKERWKIGTLGEMTVEMYQGVLKAIAK